MTQPEWPVMDEGQPREPNLTEPPAAAGSAGSPATQSPTPQGIGTPTGPGRRTCPTCGRPVDPSAWYCEACGGPLLPTSPPAPAAPPSGDMSAQTRRLGARASQVVACPACGGSIGADGYCQTCGAKAPSLRDHFTAAPAPWVGGVCDRGVQHHRNEDAMALWAEGDRAVLVVCDGVSTSVDSDVAAMAAAGRACDVLSARTSQAAVDADADAAMARALVEATSEANRAVIDTTAPDSTNAASATFAAAVVVGDRVHFANVGDSRVYFLGGGGHQLLSLDDSMAQAFIAEGMPREEAEALPRAHAITKWLGRDAVDTTPRTGVLQVTAPGWLVVCTDGLWNYASTPDELATQLPADSDPVAVAQHLVAWANGLGGHDNVTVALARVPAPAAAAAPGSLDPAPTDQEKEQPQHG